MNTADQWYSFDSSASLPELHGKSDILEQRHIRDLSRLMPARAEGYSWTLAFTTTQMGFSLKSLYRSLSKYEGPVLLLIKDSNHIVFGAFSSSSLRVSESFYGTGETYLFTFKPQQQQLQANNNISSSSNNNNNNNNIIMTNNNLQPSSGQSDSSTTTTISFKRFPWTGDNLFFIKGNTDSLAFGAGEGSFGLWLDEDLYHGSTHPCKTFNNEPLTINQDFVVCTLECWCFL